MRDSQARRYFALAAAAQKAGEMPPRLEVWLRHAEDGRATRKALQEENCVLTRQQ